MRCTLYAILIVGLLTGCGNPTPIASLTPTALATLTDPTTTPIAETDATATFTSPPALAVLLAPPGSDSAQAEALQTALNDTITTAGLHWQVRQQLLPIDLTPELRLVVALPPDPGLAAMAAAAPETQFLAVGIPGLTATPNLSLTGTQGARPDQQGFIAGYLAALLTIDYRIGVISVSDSTEGIAARNGFLNGAVFYCGLCKNYPEDYNHPPYYDYPRYVELPAGATTAAWQEAANNLIDHYVAMVYVTPGAGDEAMLATLAAADVMLIGSSVPNEVLQANWVLSFSSDPLAQVQALVPQLLAGQGGQDLPLPLEFSQINPELFSPGKQNLMSAVLADLLAGYIDTGVDPVTGGIR